jgi:hypothetical protein
MKKNTEFAKHSKIIEKALRTSFSSPETISALMDIISQTDNYIVATEVLLGVYELPALGEAHPECAPAILHKYIVDYDKYTETIKYSGMKPVKDEDGNETGALEVYESTCTLKQWQTGSRW